MHGDPALRSGQDLAVDVAEVAARAWDDLDGGTPRRDIDFSLEGDGVAWADEQGVEQVMRNLLDNARRYTPDGGSVAVRVNATAPEAGELRGRVWVEVADSGPRALAAGPDGNIWYSAFRASRIGRITPAGEITEFVLPRPNAGPGDITAGADGAMWFLQLSGTMDGVQVDGGRIGRITMDGVITEHALPTRTPSPINIAVGPDRNIWYTQGSWVGRMTPDGQVTQLPLGEGSRGAGLTAGSDRQPPQKLVNRLYIADGGANRIAWLEFAVAADQDE